MLLEEALPSPSPRGSGGRALGMHPDVRPAKSAPARFNAARTDPQPLTHAVARPSRTPVLRLWKGPSPGCVGPASAVFGPSVMSTRPGRRCWVKLGSLSNPGPLDGTAVLRL
jgi:hypothetical protein